MSTYSKSAAEYLEEQEIMLSSCDVKTEITIDDLPIGSPSCWSNHEQETNHVFSDSDNESRRSNNINVVPLQLTRNEQSSIEKQSVLPSENKTEIEEELEAVNEKELGELPELEVLSEGKDFYFVIYLHDA